MDDELEFESAEATRTELDRLLALAENLRRRIAMSNTRGETFRVLELAVGVTGLGAAALVNMHNNATALIDGGTWAALGGLAAFYVLTIEYYVRRLQRRTYPDRIALREVVQILRETGQAIAARDEWSPLERAEFRIRLSQFSIDGDTV